MSESEEDYMSDKFLSGSSKTDVRPGLLFRQSQKRSLEIYKKERLPKKPTPQGLDEEERREVGLNTALSSENKGFKMLQRMGYTPGTGLGKSLVGIKEPVSITLKKISTGLGLEQHIIDKKKRKIDLKEKHLQACENEFLASRTERVQAMFLRGDISKARRLCEDLDMKKGITYPEHPHFWQKTTIAALKEKMKKKQSDVDDAYEDEESSSSSCCSDTEEQEDTVLFLEEIIKYLRSTYSYCMYCGDFVEDESECPGYFRIDHE